MTRVVVLSGVSGSGKSRYARWLCEGVGASLIVSADDYFTTRIGGYVFDPSKLGQAHGACFDHFLAALDSHALVIVDNTNTTAWEIAPYMLAAWRYKVEIHTIAPGDSVNLQCCADRNAHGVSLSAIQAQAHRIKTRDLPPMWTHKVVTP